MNYFDSFIFQKLLRTAVSCIFQKKYFDYLRTNLNFFWVNKQNDNVLYF